MDKVKVFKKRYTNCIVRWIVPIRLSYKIEGLSHEFTTYIDSIFIYNGDYYD